MLYLIGAGAALCHLTQKCWELLTAHPVMLQTRNCYLAPLLTERGIPFDSCDDLYEAAEDFDELNQAIAERLAARAKEEDLVYALPGAASGKAVCRVIAGRAKEAGIALSVFAGVSFAEAALAVSGLFFEVSPRTLYAAELPGAALDVTAPLVVQELSTPLIAADAKLALCEYYPDEWSVTLVSPDEGRYTARDLPLWTLDRLSPQCFAPETCLILSPPEFTELQRRGVAQVGELVRRLRAPGGCPWDREQTFESLRPDVLEEAYEVAEAIDLKDEDKLCEELGDLLLQVVFLSVIAEEHALFTLRDVTTGLCAKLVYRHPHVFGDAIAEDSAAVLAAWDKLKKAEKHQTTQTDVLRAVPKPLPALTRARKVQKKAKDVGFDWNDPLDALQKVKEETGEFEAELKAQSPAAKEELGDLLFSVVNAARLAGLDPEDALNRATEKFIGRFERVEQAVLHMGKRMEDLSLAELDAIWERVKHAPAGENPGEMPVNP